MISHVNADPRAGWLNYVLIRTETQRYHQGTQVRGNYGSVTPLWDIVFGTFIYQPTQIPARLGLDDPQHLPQPRAVPPEPPVALPTRWPSRSHRRAMPCASSTSTVRLRTRREPDEHPVRGRQPCLIGIGPVHQQVGQLDDVSEPGVV